MGVGEEGGEGRGGEGKGGPHLQQQLQAATESVQLSTGVCHGLSAPVTLDDGRDSSCGEGGGHRTAASEGPEGEAPRLLTSPSVQFQKISQDILTFQVPGDLEGNPLFCHEYLKMM